jgi:hypothetical protein
MEMIKKYFVSSLVFTVIALALSAVVGHFYGGGSVIVSFLITAALLAVLEIAVSLDNAVVNAGVLKDMDEKWQRRFLTWGMLVAVFGMRLVFPIAIVSIAGGIPAILNWGAIASGADMSEWFKGSALYIGLFEPTAYKALLTSVNTQVMAFGGTFLLMVFASHFIDHEKEVHWIPVLGPVLSKIGKHSTARIFIPLIIVAIFAQFVGAEKEVFIMSAVWGTVTYLMVDGLGDLFDVEDAAATAGKTGFAGFMYLEVVDASFSFDGVIAAFAITDNFLIIMLGLSIGAMFVRSMTIMLVEKGTLSEFRYLEDGAFWGIGWLVFAMFAHVLHYELGEATVAGGAAAAIALAVWHSVIVNKREAKAELSQIKE